MASNKENENRIQGLNRLLGFKGLKYSKTRKKVGKEFYMGGEYGRVYLGYRSANSSKKISENLTKNELEEFLKGYKKGMTTKKSDFK